MKSLLALLGLLLATVFSAFPCGGQKLCSPAQWESACEVTLLRGKKFNLLKAYNILSYDTKGLRLTERSTVILNGKQTFNYLRVIRYDNGEKKPGMQYLLNMDTGICQTNKLSVPFSFQKLCIDDDMKFTDNEFLGMYGKEGVSVANYEKGTYMQDDMMTVQMKKEGVIPVRIYQTNIKAGEEPRFYEALFSNLTLGIKNPHVFDIPKGCKKQSNGTIAFPEYLKHGALIFGH